MPIITVHIEDELKRRRKKVKHIKWSGVVRQAIIRVVGEEEAQNLAKAVLLNERNVMVPDEGYSSAEVIRE